MTLRYWQRVGGTLLLEFPAVKRANGRAERRIDARDPSGRVDGEETPQ